MMSVRTRVARSFISSMVGRRAGQGFGCVRGLQTAERKVQSQQHGSFDSEKEAFLNFVDKDQSLQNDMAYSLSFADSGSIEDSLAFSILPNAIMRQQLAACVKKVPSPPALDSKPLPRTLEDALRPSNRALVITETAMPFKIVDVNQAWEGLCGYSAVECQGRTLGSLLRGPETDQSAVTALVSRLLGGEEAGTVLTNYKKDGSKFRNHLRVGPLFQDGEISHFVGVLQEMH